MEIVVHGTKGGYRMLYITPNAPSIAYDMRNNVSSENALGQSAYSFAVATNGCVFIKYCIVRDTLRNYATGTIAFSLFLPSDTKMSGANIQAILDELMEYYCKNYIKENNMNRDKMDIIIHEDWSFVQSISDKYASKLGKILPEDIENRQPGSKDAAFIYYSDAKLHKYFDVAPSQDEYAEYKQVLFVNKDLKGKANDPLNILRHSEDDLTERIDLDNPFYRLRGFNGFGNKGVSIKIINNKGQSLQDNNKIFRKETITVEYSKKYYHSISEEGSLNDEKIKKYLTVNEDSRRIDVKKDVELRPEEKNISFEIKDWKGNSVSNVEITCSNNSQLAKPVRNNKITFSGEELGQKWQISAKSKNMFSYEIPITITPENINENEFVTITLIKRIKIKVNVIKIIKKGNCKPIYNFRIRVNNREYRSELIFENDDIERLWNIEVSTRDGYYGKIENYCPAANENPLYIKLEKSLVKRVLQYPKLITAIIVVLIFAVLGIWLWRSSFKTEKQEQEQDLGKKITEYVEGMELIPDTLNSYENQWKNKKPKITESLLSMLFPFWVEKDSTEYKEWNKTMQKINTAILLRGLIRNHNFAELKKQNYSAEQDSFKQTVISYIDSALYQEVGDSLKKKNEDLDKMKLSDITITINSIVNSIKEKGTPKRKVEAKKPEARTENTHIPQDNSQAQTQPVSPASTDKTKKIKNYLQGDELKKDSLERYKKDANTTLKASIDLCLEFWRLVKEENNQMDNFCDLLTKIKNNDTLKTSELKTFLDGICANSEAFSKYNSSPGKRKYQTLKNLKNNIR